MTDRTFWLSDTALHYAASSGRTDPRLGWDSPDYETFNRLIGALEAKGFAFGLDPWIDHGWPSLNKYHRMGRRETPAGTLFVVAECTPTGGHFDFFQEIVTVNHNGGRWDFDKRHKMPYLIGKAFEVAITAARAHLASRGFAERLKIRSPVPDLSPGSTRSGTANTSAEQGSIASSETKQGGRPKVCLRYNAGASRRNVRCCRRARCATSVMMPVA